MEQSVKNFNFEICQHTAAFFYFQSDCTLQIYGKYLIAEHKMKNQGKKLANGPHSSQNARGLIVVHGMLGQKVPYHSDTRTYQYNAEANIFVSGDGGYTWIMVREN